MGCRLWRHLPALAVGPPVAGPAHITVCQQRLQLVVVLEGAAQQQLRSVQGMERG
jgi:hypothetical protein